MSAPSAHELDGPPWRRVESTLMTTSRAIRRAYDVRLAPLGLNLSEASLLACVNEGGPSTQVRLAERLGMNRASAGTIIDLLQTRGLVTKDPSPDDRRVWLVSTTEAGRALADEVRSTDVALRRELRSGISREDRAHLARTLLRLRTNLNAVQHQESRTER